jgi:tetratricopeptide (TPR) repeat protein
MDAGQWEQALAGFKEVLALNPNTHQAYGNMGICHGILGRRDEALAAIDKALEIEPDYEVALLNRVGIEDLKEGERLPLERFLSVNVPQGLQHEGASRCCGQVVDKLKV